jgi:lipopolysaccharide export LptBFGC system permease protein LptF
MNTSLEEKILDASLKLLLALLFLLVCLLVCTSFFYVLDKITQNKGVYFLGGTIYMAVISWLVGIINRVSK